MVFFYLCPRAGFGHQLTGFILKMLFWNLRIRPIDESQRQERALAVIRRRAAFGGLVLQFPQNTGCFFMIF